MSHCRTCTCPEISDDEYDVMCAAAKAGTRATTRTWSRTPPRRPGPEPGHEHCPDCGCDPYDHEYHAHGCRRVGAGIDFQCGPPWKPWPPWPDEVAP